MEKKPYDHAFQYKDIPTVSETFADGIHMTTVDGSSVRITLTASRPDAPKPNQKGPPQGTKVTAARLVLSLPAFAELHNQLSNLVAVLERQGLMIREGDGVKPTVQ